jgi:hypothetical protein
MAVFPYEDGGFTALGSSGGTAGTGVSWAEKRVRDWLRSRLEDAEPTGLLLTSFRPPDRNSWDSSMIESVAGEGL